MGILDFLGDLAFVLVSAGRSNVFRMSSSLRALVEVLENFLVGEAARVFLPVMLGFFVRGKVFLAAVLDFSSVTAGSMVCLLALVVGWGSC